MAFSSDKNAAAGEMWTAANKPGLHTGPEAGFQAILPYPIHSIWLAGSEFFCFYLFSLNEQLVKSELMKLA